jgi:hypothetical protein
MNPLRPFCSTERVAASQPVGQAVRQLTPFSDALAVFKAQLC